MQYPQLTLFMSALKILGLLFQRQNWIVLFISIIFNYPHFDHQNSIVLIKIQMNVNISEYWYGTRDMDHNLILQEFCNRLLNMYTGWFNCNSFLAPTTRFLEDSWQKHWINFCHSESWMLVKFVWIVHVQLNHCYNY